MVTRPHNRDSAAASMGVQRGDQVFASLLADITGGRYEPGAKLLIEDLAGSHGVSITPVRDALARLESHGIVVKVPYQGYFVRSFDDHEIQDLYEVRVGLESLAVALASARIGDEHLQRLREVQKGGEQALAVGDLAVYQACNHDFHATILEASGNHLLMRTMGSISLQMQIMIAQTIKVPGRPDRAIREHAALVERLAQGDAQGAEELMKRHVYGALEDLGLERLG